MPRFQCILENGRKQFYSTENNWESNWENLLLEVYIFIYIFRALNPSQLRFYPPPLSFWFYNTISLHHSLSNFKFSKITFSFNFFRNLIYLFFTNLCTSVICLVHPLPLTDPACKIIKMQCIKMTKWLGKSIQFFKIIKVCIHLTRVCPRCFIDRHLKFT